MSIFTTSSKVHNLVGDHCTRGGLSRCSSVWHIRGHFRDEDVCWKTNEWQVNENKFARRRNACGLHQVSRCSFSLHTSLSVCLCVCVCLSVCTRCVCLAPTNSSPVAAVHGPVVTVDSACRMQLDVANNRTDLDTAGHELADIQTD